MYEILPITFFGLCVYISLSVPYKDVKVTESHDIGAIKDVKAGHTTNGP